MCDPPIDNGPDSVAVAEAEMLRWSWRDEFAKSCLVPECATDDMYSRFIEDKLEQMMLQAAARADERDALAKRLVRFTGRTVLREIQFAREMMEADE